MGKSASPQGALHRGPSEKIRVRQKGPDRASLRPSGFGLGLPEGSVAPGAGCRGPEGAVACGCQLTVSSGHLPGHAHPQGHVAC